MSEDETPCHWVKCEDGTLALIPMCYGGAHDPKECTCEYRGSKLERAQEALHEAEATIERLKETNRRLRERTEQQFNADRRLRERIRELEALVRSTPHAT